ncbi:MAG: BrnA antitoxin family protein [Clostridiales bacterium]|nr:BrnA antitoxin family protein [Clostridiales bacterium]MCD8224222.1 BrnA antitoxin family protein [Clostridiales bacterium]
MIVRKTIDVNQEPTQEQIDTLIKAGDHRIMFDEDCPQLTDEDLAQFYRVSEKRREERKKQTVTIRLSPQALNTAKSLGKGYTSVLSRILENALKDKDVIKRYL